MVFKRRDARTWLQVMVHLFYPKGGWGRAAYYVGHRLRRLPDPPHKIARGIAAGVFVCFTPFFGLHFLFAAMLSFVMQGNILASLLATFFGNPITFPIIAAVSLELGHWMLGIPNGAPRPQIFAEFSQASLEIWHNTRAMFTSDVAHWERLSRFYWHVAWPYIVGGIIPGTICGVTAYMLALPAVRAYQNRRVKKLKARFKKRHIAAEKADAGPKAD